MDALSAQSIEPFAKSRRQYKRFPSAKWEELKPLIQELFLLHELTIEKVVDVLRDEHDFDVGKRQLKRRLNKWRIGKNIPSDEMRKMVCISICREREQKPRLVFKRRQADGTFLVVPQHKLDRYRKAENLSIVSDYMYSPSDLPSHIICGTASAASLPAVPTAPSSCPGAEFRGRSLIQSIERFLSSQDHVDFASDFKSDAITLDDYDNVALEGSFQLPTEAELLSFDLDY